jgi:hypothetical protein
MLYVALKQVTTVWLSFLNNQNKHPNFQYLVKFFSDFILFSALTLNQCPVTEINSCSAEDEKALCCVWNTTRQTSPKPQ